MVRILILTQYYPPETGAPQNRLSGLAAELSILGHEVHVLTAMPNYPAMEIHKQYRGLFFKKEFVQQIHIYRSWIYVSKNRSIFSRLLNYFSFTFSSLFNSFRIKGDFDVLMCESPPLFLGMSGWAISKFKKAKFIFNVSDLWPESAEKLGVITNRFFLNLATKLEEFLYRSSFMVTGQTQGIVKNINDRVPDKMVHWLPNGVDESIFNTRIDPERRIISGFAKDDFLILYGGIIGIAQGLDVILDASLLLSKDSKIKFLLLGEGPEKERLMARKKKENLDRIYFLNLIDRAEVPAFVSSIDAAVIPLKKMDLFLGAIPSKIFENLALEKPILLGVDGEAKELFINDARCGLFFEPENAHALAREAGFLENNPQEVKEMGRKGKEYVKKNFIRKDIVNKWMEVLHDAIRK